MPTVDTKLVPFSPQYLRVGEALPFSVHDAAGQLLLAAGQVIDSPTRLAHLTAQPLTINEDESAEWRRRLVVTMDAMLRQNVSLKNIAAARPGEEAGGRTAAEAPLPERWEDSFASLDALLREARPEAAWLARLFEQEAATHRQHERRPDASLYYMVWRAGQVSERYCASHSCLVQGVLTLAAPFLGLDAVALQELRRAALAMNVAMVRLQDMLATTDRPLTPAVRTEIEQHAAQSAALLRMAGAAPVLCDLVAWHHQVAMPAGADPAHWRQAQLLRRVDIFTAKLSRRKTRAPMLPTQAARQACLGPDGRPDDIGAALLKGLGLYPPGCFVQLASGELGIVVQRRANPSQPAVASLVNAQGMPMGEPTLRDTSDPRWAVKTALPADAVRVRPIHAKVLALI